MPSTTLVYTSTAYNIYLITILHTWTTHTIPSSTLSYALYRMWTFCHFQIVEQIWDFFVNYSMLESKFFDVKTLYWNYLSSLWDKNMMYCWTSGTSTSYLGKGMMGEDGCPTACRCFWKCMEHSKQCSNGNILHWNFKNWGVLQFHSKFRIPCRNIFQYYSPIIAVNWSNAQWLSTAFMDSSIVQLLEDW